MSSNKVFGQFKSAGAKSKGAKQHRAKKRLHANFDQIYSGGSTETQIEKQEFRIVALRPDIDRKPKIVTDLIERLQWRDEGNEYNLNTIPVLRGSVNFRTKDPDLPSNSFVLHDGHRLRTDVNWGGVWLPLWEMRIDKPPEHNVSDGTASATLSDDLVIAAQSEGYFRYRAGKNVRRRGWRYDEIVRDVCERYRIPVGDLLRGKRLITHFAPSGQPISPLEAIRQVVLLEQEWSGFPLVIAWRPRRDGSFGLRVSAMTRNPVLYRFANDIRAATSSPVRKAQLATAVVASGSGKTKTKTKTAKRKKFKPVRVVDAKAIRQYGYIERRVTVPGNVASRAELERKAKADLARFLKPVRVITNFEHPGIAFVRRGDTVRIDLPEDGFSGSAGIMFVTTVEHTLEPSDYTIALDMTWRDPLNPESLRAQREKAIRDRKRKKNGGTYKDAARQGSPPAVGNGLLYPLPIHGTDLGGVAAHHARPLGNWQSDNAVDIGVPRGTHVYAVDDGEITMLTGSWDGTGKSNPNGFNVTLVTRDNSWFYTHMEHRAPLREGERVKAGAFLGLSGAANGVNHLHIASLNGDPEALLKVI